LPGFAGLVTQLYEALGEVIDGVEKTAFKESRFDTALYLLERRLESATVPSRRTIVREKLWRILSNIDTAKPKATETHRSLLTLSTTRKGQTRLVTTNFDRLFYAADPRIPSYSAPLLPIPKPTRWNGIVYLHGFLPERPDADALNHLIVSSGDFGLAYLTERWASRFVAEIFRGYVICFVGYSLNDPVLRYMVDALSADQLRGEKARDVFAFGSFKRRNHAGAQREWESKGVIPILYAETPTHAHLHRTLKVWADDYRDGVTGKQAIIQRYAPTQPSTVQGLGQVSRVLWAISDPSGLPAKAFAELIPPAPIEWLKMLIDPLYDDTDLQRFGVPVDESERLKSKFSVLHRPTSYLRSHWTMIAGQIAHMSSAPALDRIAYELSRWLAMHHLDKPDLLQWVIDRGACLHPTFAHFVRLELAKGVLQPPLSAVWRIIARDSP
jgi:hypothetical protein